MGDIGIEYTLTFFGKVIAGINSKSQLRLRYWQRRIVVIVARWRGWYAPKNIKTHIRPFKGRGC